MNVFAQALRQVVKHPGFSTLVILTLALGIGANVAMFSIVNAVLLRPLPYPNPEQLVTLWERSLERGVDQELVSGPNYLDWKRENTVLANMAVNPGWQGAEQFNLVIGADTTRIVATYASASLFSTLGQPPLLGRVLQPEDDIKEGPAVAVLSHGLWQRQFGGDTNVIGRTLTLDTYGRRSYTIVGVMPPGFGLPSRCELWLPLGWMDVSLDERRSAHWHNVIARLKPGVTLEQARHELTAIQQRIRRAHPEATIGSEVVVVPLLDQALGRNLRRALLVLWGVVTGVLLIACANVANLMLARAASRQREISIRIALGAQRWRIVGQLLTESLLLALAAGAVGTLLGWAGIQLYLAAGPGDIPRLGDVAVDAQALLFTFAISAATGLLFGLAPAWQCSQPDVDQALKEGSRHGTAGTSSSRTRNLLVVAEVALSVILLAAAGLMLQSFARILRADRGFASRHLLTAELDFSVSGYTTWVQPTATRPQVPLHSLIERLRSLPGVEAVGAGSRLLRRDNKPPHEAFSILGRAPLPPGQQPRAEFKGITPDWVRALGGRVLRGRDFTEADILEAPGVMLINATLARRYFPDQDPIGQRMKMGTSQPDLGATNVWGLPEWSEIVGVIDDIKSLHPHPEAIPEVYAPYWQWPMQSPTIILRAAGDPRSLADHIRREVKAAIPNLPPARVRTMDSLLGEMVAQPRLQAGILALFAGTALALAAIGLYGVLTFTVAQRQREIGIRLALGAARNHVLSLVIRQGMKLVLVGAALGGVGSLALNRVLRSLLYHVHPSDPLTLLLVLGLLMAVALLACWWPARRAAGLNPIDALRTE